MALISKDLPHVILRRFSALVIIDPAPSNRSMLSAIFSGILNPVEGGCHEAEAVSEEQMAFALRQAEGDIAVPTRPLSSFALRLSTGVESLDTSLRQWPAAGAMLLSGLFVLIGCFWWSAG